MEYGERFIEGSIESNHDCFRVRSRKKDFWDIHALMDDYALAGMLQLHEQRYPYTHEAKIIREKMKDFSEADNDFDPICLSGKYWEIIKYEIVKWVDHSSRK